MIAQASRKIVLSVADSSRKNPKAVEAALQEIADILSEDGTRGIHEGSNVYHDIEIGKLGVSHPDLLVALQNAFPNAQTISEYRGEQLGATRPQELLTIEAIADVFVIAGRYDEEIPHKLKTFEEKGLRTTDEQLGDAEISVTHLMASKVEAA